MTAPPATADRISSRELARRVGATGPAIRKLLGAKDSPRIPGAEWDDRLGRWQIEPDSAIAWLRANAPIIGPRIAAAMADDDPAPCSAPDPLDLVDIRALGEPNGADDDDDLAVLIADMKVLLDVIRGCLRKTGFHPSLFTAFKQITGEVRSMIKLRRSEQEADERVIDADDHRIVVLTFARMVRQEADSLPRMLPDQIVSALTESGAELVAADAIQVVSAVVDQGVRAYLERLAQYAQNAINERAAHATP